MRGWLTLSLGLLAVVVGGVWTLQGLGHLDGSVMTGQRIWTVFGPLLALAGLVLVGLGLRARRRAKDQARAGSAQPGQQQPGQQEAGPEQAGPEQRRAPQ